MKKLLFVTIAAFVIGAMLQGCGSEGITPVNPNPEVNVNGITEEMAYEGVSNYCHSHYDWSIAEDDPSVMYLEMGEENESEYQVIFRSYTGSFVYFYVDKSDGATRIVEYVPTLDIESDLGTIDLFDQLDEGN